MKIIVLFQVFCVLFKKINTQEINIVSSTVSNVDTRFESILMTHRCPMLKNSCIFEISVKKHGKTDFKMSDFIVNVNGTRYFSFIKLESCDDKNREYLTDVECYVHSANVTNILGGDEDYKTIFIIIKSIVVGKGRISLESKKFNETIENIIIITQPERIIDSIHRIFIIAFGTLIATSMGLLLDVETILKIIKMPKPVLIGFLTQYTCMPLLAFACIKIFSFSPIEALALFVYGCCPGGSGSNNWTIMLNGDIDLSAIMTFVSTMASIVLMPAWVYTLGRVFTVSTEINIPFSRLLLNLLNTIVPCLIGLWLSRCFPKLKPIVIKIAKPFVIIFLLTFLTFTMFVKYYVFTLVHWKQWATAPFVPWLGFLIGGTISWLFRLPLKQCVTIALETGIQNVGVAFLIITYNFPSPESDYAILPLISVSSLTTIPLWFVLLGLTIKKKLKARSETKNKALIIDDELKKEALLEEKK